MSIFDETPSETPSESFVDQLVAAKGDQFRDPEAMAKSLLSADPHIKKLEAENATYREAQQKEAFAESLLEELRKTQTPTSGEVVKPESTGGDEGATTPTNPEDIKKLVEEAISLKEQESTVAQNVAEADRLMVERFGDQAGSELGKKAEELGVSKEYMLEVAQKSPNAFMRLMGDAPAQQTNSSTEGSVNTSALQVSNSNGKKSWSYYKELMRKDEKTYRSREVQAQLNKDIAEQGDAFFQS